MEKQKDEIERLLSKLNELSDQTGSSKDLALLTLKAKLINQVTNINSQTKYPCDFQSVNNDNLETFVLNLTNVTKNLFECYEQIFKELPSESIGIYKAELNSYKNNISDELDQKALEMKYLKEEILEKQDEKMKLAVSLRELIKESDELSIDIKKLEDNVRKYTRSNQKILNGLPNKLESTSEKLSSIERQLGEVDEEIQGLLEEFKEDSNVLEKLLN